MSANTYKKTPPLLFSEASRRFIREELERGSRNLEFLQGQMEKDRGSLKFLFGLAGGILAFMFTVGGVTQYASVSQMRADTRSSVDAEVERGKAEIVALRAQAQNTVSTELQSVYAEVQRRLDLEFTSEAITDLVRKTAKERTQKEFAPIIRSETSRDTDERFVDITKPQF